jgi:adenylate kinase family enzyme
MGAGKTTYAKKLAKENNALYLSEDDWLSALYPNEINNFDDYITCSLRLKPMIKDHIIKLLNLGISIVMDFPGNTIKQRKWLLSIANDAKVNHELRYLKASDEICLKHLEKRREAIPERNQFDTEEVFKQVTKYFEEPRETEGINIRWINN